jgi:hypothetical protein
MNERIKELIFEAVNFRLDPDSNSYEAQVCPEDLESLAELIVRECLGIVKSNTYGPAGEYNYSYSDESAAADKRAETIYEDISYRFGVEE